MENLSLAAERIIPQVDGIDHDDHIFISENAIEAIRSIKEENGIPADMYLRLGTKSGGCSGMNYVIGFDTLINDNDSTFKIRDHNIVIDKKSIFFLMGVTLDYINDVGGSGFVFNNPYNESGCGGCSHY